MPRARPEESVPAVAVSPAAARDDDIAAAGVISIRGARTHNLRNINVDVPRNRLVVITGLSGSGKSTLAFDTIYAEGRRRYVESLSTYARQFLSVMERPDVDHIEGLSPAIAIEQRSGSANPRSTVGTVTEIHDHLRLLFARVGEPRCPEHDIVLKAQTVSQMVDAVMARAPGERLMLLAPVVRAGRGAHREVLESLRASGFVRARIDGEVVDLDAAGAAPLLDEGAAHDIEAVVDRFRVRPDLGSRLAESFETALSLANGWALVAPLDGDDDKDGGGALVFSARFACPECGHSLPELEPRLFSFNSPAGACPACDGLGWQPWFDPERVVSRPGVSLPGGAIRGWDRTNPYYLGLLESLAAHYDFDLDLPFRDLPESVRHVVLHGSGDEPVAIRYGARADGGGGSERKRPFEGVLPNMERRYRETESQQVREELARYMAMRPCPECGGARLNRDARSVRVAGRALPELTRLPIGELRDFFRDGMHLEGQREEVAARLVHEIGQRLDFLIDVGLDYLSLDRSADSLSGGEGRRIRLASQIGAGLVGVMYVLDEPSIGLHQRDNRRLLDSLARLRDLGNTVIVVEHDEEGIREADWIIDMGPGPGLHGGEVVAEGRLDRIMAAPASLTGRYLAGELQVVEQRARRAPSGWLRIEGASANNLQSLEVAFPLSVMTCVTGVSGSGKSSLVHDTLYQLLAGRRRIDMEEEEEDGVLAIGEEEEDAVGDNDAAGTEDEDDEDENEEGGEAAEFVREVAASGIAGDGATPARIVGAARIDKVINIDQSPIGRTPRSNPATYAGLFTPIRDLFAATPEARARGYTPGRFSFNVAGGRCEACRGDGVLRVEMHFLPDVFVRCDVCRGRRYDRETLSVHYRGKSISEVLDMTVEEAYAHFEPIPAVARRLRTLIDVGLGYIGLGQSATTLSGGEAQRMKLARELSRRDSGRTLYVLDEPTTGLHFHDVRQLLQVLDRLVERGNTVVVIEHNLEVVGAADWVIDLGPEGGAGGGRLMASGTPETVAEVAESHTGRYLAAQFARAADANDNGNGAAATTPPAYKEGEEAEVKAENSGETTVSAADRTGLTA